MSKKEKDRAEKRLLKHLKGGGQRNSLSPGQVLYERRGGEKPSERITYLDRANDARCLMSAKIQLPDGLRSVGNLYGHYVVFAELGPATPFVKETIDGGGGSSTSVTQRMMEAKEIAGIAQYLMKTMPLIRHEPRKGKFVQGPHHPISVRDLVDAICVHGQDVTETALRSGWWAKRSEEEDAKHFLPKRQHQKLAAALRGALEEIDEEFKSVGIDARRILGVVEVK